MNGGSETKRASGPREKKSSARIAPVAGVICSLLLLLLLFELIFFFSLSENDNKVARGARGCAFCIITINFIIIAVKYAASDWPVH